MKTPSPYLLDLAPLILDEGVKRYPLLTVRDLPPAEKPREKLLSAGPEALSLAELMAVVLSVGTTKEDVLSMSRRLMQEYGEKSVASLKDAKKFAQDAGLPITKAEQIVATVEIGRRLFSRNQAGARVVRTARDVFDYAKAIRDLPKEHLMGIYLNAHYKVIHEEILSIGTVDTNIVHPREVFKPALEYSAAAVILAHNHPSGEADPSDPDLLVTRQLIEAGKMLGVPFIDHVVVTTNDFRSVPADYSL
jgi:DNA repair protein RadC